MTRHDDTKRGHYLMSEADCLDAIGDSSAATVANGILSLIRLGSTSDAAVDAVMPLLDDVRDVAFGIPLNVFSGAYLELAGMGHYTGPLRDEVDRIKSAFGAAN